MTQITIDRPTLEQLLEDVLQINREIGKGGVAYDINNRAHPPIKRSLDALRAALANAEPTGWQKIETAPKDKSVMLHCRGFIPFYCGRKRYGNLGEPQQSELAWRCDSSGRFANPTHWMPLPASPKDTL